MSKETFEESTYDGDVVNAFTWGTGEGGQLGYGSRSNNTPIVQDVPRPVFPIGASANQRVVRAAAGGRHSMFLLKSGTLLACGVWDEGQLGCKDRPPVVMVPGTTREMAPVPKSLVPRGFEPFPLPVRVQDKLVVKEIAAGFSSSFLVTDFGEVWAWGSGKYGCLGLGDCKGRWYPERIEFFAEYRGVAVEMISAGKWHAICLSNKGAVYAWGRNNWGQLGNDETSACERSPIEVSICLVKNCAITQVSAGAEHCVALVDLQRLNRRREVVAFAWGNPGNGRLGTRREQTHATPMEVVDLTEALRKSKHKPASISCGGEHTLVALSSGRVAAWGAGGYGQLGDGHMWDRPESVMVAELHGVRSVSAGARHSVALVQDLTGTHVWGWGFNRWGEVGGGDDFVRLQPQRVGGLGGCTVRSVLAGERQTIALTNGRALQVKDLRDYRVFIDAFCKGGMVVYDDLKKRMAEMSLKPDWLDAPFDYFPGQPGMTDAECRQGTAEHHMDWCMDKAPPGKDVFTSLRGGHEVVYSCRPCRRERICLACAHKCHSKHCIEPVFRHRSKAEPCDCSTTSGMCICKWSPMRMQFRGMSDTIRAPGRPTLVEDGSLHPSRLRELLQIVRGGAAVINCEDVENGQTLLTQGGEKEYIDFLQFERWYEEYFRKIDAELLKEKIALDDH